MIITLSFYIRFKIVQYIIENQVDIFYKLNSIFYRVFVYGFEFYLTDNKRFRCLLRKNIKKVENIRPCELPTLVYNIEDVKKRNIK